MSRLRRILYPTDFSGASGAAFARAVAMAKTERASARQYAQKRLSALQAKARKAGVKAVTLILEGIAHEQIVRAVKTKKADLIVIGTHGRTGLAKFFLGSVASRVVAAAPCPVLTVRGR